MENKIHVPNHQPDTIPSSKFLHRPRQGLEEYSFHEKLGIFRVYVYLPEGNMCCIDLNRDLVDWDSINSLILGVL